MSYEDGRCDLCRQEAYCHTKYYATAPFVDGKCYGYLCWVCLNTPIGETDQLHSLKDMREHGFGEIESKISYDALNKSIQHKPTFVDIFNDILIQTDIQF